MIYYAIKDKEKGKIVSRMSEFETLVEELRISDCFMSEDVATDVLNNVKKRLCNPNLIVVPVELREVEEKQKPKWYEIRPKVRVRLDKIEKVEICSCERNMGRDSYGREKTKKVWQVWLYSTGNTSYTGDLTEEEATAKYNELKKLLEEV